MTAGIRDSKHLSAKQREDIFEAFKNIPGIEWRVSFVQPKTIDKINIWQATLLAWRRCLKKLPLAPDFLFLDGKFDLNGDCCQTRLPRLPQIRKANSAGLAMAKKCVQLPIIKGDQKIFLVSLASIVAKVSRDRLMEKLDKKYPEYGFAFHKGYGTKLHLERLKKYGPCLIHRRSFKPVFDNLSFCDKVYYAVSRIPRGQTITYKDVAWQIGQPNAFRAVGNVLNKNFNPKIPCHRVIRSDGKIGGYNRGGELKKELLKKEKVNLAVIGRDSSCPPSLRSDAGRRAPASRRAQNDKST